MKLIGNLKKQVDKATDISEKRSLIENAGMKLTDDELDMVVGGSPSVLNVTKKEYPRHYSNGKSSSGSTSGGNSDDG